MSDEHNYYLISYEYISYDLTRVDMYDVAILFELTKQTNNSWKICKIIKNNGTNHSFMVDDIIYFNGNDNMFSFWCQNENNVITKMEIYYTQITLKNNITLYDSTIDFKITEILEELNNNSFIDKYKKLYDILTAHL
jgi:hypothetical protein